MIFTALKKTHDAYLDLHDGFKKALNELEAITTAAEERIEAEKAKSAERATVLKERLSSPDTPQSIQRMAESELTELEQYEFKATQRERDAFVETVTTAREIIRDMADLERSFRNEFKVVQDELASMRSNVLGDQGKDLRSCWIKKEEDRFSRLWE